MKYIAKGVARLVIHRPGTIGFLLLAATAFSLWRVSQLEINHNQIELIPQDLPSVQATQRMIDLTGGIGYLMLPLKSNDLAHMKGVADDLAERLLQLPEIRHVWYKQDVGFVRDRVALFVKTDDLREGIKRIRKKIRQVINKANPFYVALAPTDETAKPDAPLALDDLVAKYKHVNKKRIDDPYFLDKNNEMLLLVIKPHGNATNLQFAAHVLQVVQNLIADYNAHNTRQAKLVEHYGGLAPGATVTYGFTGSYKTNLDDSQTLTAALIPTSVVSFLGIFLYLLIALRRPTQIILLMLLLVISVTQTFAFCELVVGELNTVTAILGAILMGLGIDFGIHFLYRFREEYTRDRHLANAVRATIEHSGVASATSAITTAAALYVLTLSDFRGFADFGLIAGTGVLLTCALMYIGVPTIYILLDRVAPTFKDNLIVASQNDQPALRARRYPAAKAILAVTLLLTVAFTYAAVRVRFDYDSRSMMTVNRPSILLSEELRARYQVSSDPVGYYTQDLADTHALYDLVTPIPEDSTVDSIASVFTLVPDPQQQKDNRVELDKLQERLRAVDLDIFTADERALYNKYKHLLDAQPFSENDLPPHIKSQFHPVPELHDDGYLTFIYPRVTVYDGRELIKFADEVGAFNVNGKMIHGGGMAVLYADLARIVLADGEHFTFFAAGIIFLLILVGLRSIKGAVFAMLPLIAGLVWLLGVMALLDWRINFMNIVVFPVVFGYGISSGIHLFQRFRESRSIYLAVRRTGAAVAASSITTSIGWGALLVSRHRGLESMGMLACVGIASALGVSLTVMPALLQVFQSDTESPSRDANAVEQVS